MSDKAPLYGLISGHPEQLEIIEATCFGTCGQIIFGAVDHPDVGTIMVCRTPGKNCPALDREMDVSSFDVDGEPLYLRKLAKKDAKNAAL